MLIRKDDAGNWAVTGIKWSELREGCTLTKETAAVLYGALCKLKDYEDTGLEPDEVDSLTYKLHDADIYVEKLKEVLR